MDKMQSEVKGQGDRRQLVQVFYLDQALTKQATKGICIGIFVKGTKWIKDQNDRRKGFNDIC